MQTLKKFYFGKQKAKVNTYIGGIGATINTPALLAAKLGIAVNRIKLFKVIGVDVECAITGGSYTFQSFINDYEVTSYIDTDGLVTSLGSGQFNTCSNFRYGYFPKVVLLNNASVLQNSIGNYTLELPEANSITVSNLLGAGTNLFMRKRFYVPKLSSFGTNKLDNSVFLNNSELSLKVYAPISEQTSNSGSVEGDLQKVITNGGEVVFVSNFTKPNSVSDLSNGVIYNTAAQLNFTTPTVTANNIDYYEVYVNNFFYKEITSSGQYVTGLVKGSNNAISLKTVDVFGNKSDFSNKLNITTSSSYITPINMVANYPFDENIKSTIGSSFRWTIPLNVNFTTGKLHRCLNFSTINNTISIQDGTAYSFSDSLNDLPFTVGMWINSTQFLGNGSTIMQKVSGANGGDTYDFFFDTSGRLNIKIFDKANRAIFLRGTTITGAVILNTWIHLVFAYDGSKAFSGLKIYVNGVNMTLTNNSVGAYTGMPMSNVSISLGRSAFGGWTYYGKLEQLFICKNYEMPISEISQIYNSGNGIIL